MAPAAPLRLQMVHVCGCCGAPEASQRAWHGARFLASASVFFSRIRSQLACFGPTSARRRFLSVDGSGRLFPAARWLWRRSEADLESTLWRGHRLVQSVESVQLEAKAAQGGVRTPPQAASSSATPALRAPRREAPACRGHGAGGGCPQGDVGSVFMCRVQYP